VLVKVNNLVFLADFYILNMEGGYSLLVLLQLFLASPPKNNSSQSWCACRHTYYGVQWQSNRIQYSRCYERSS